MGSFFLLFLLARETYYIVNSVVVRFVLPVSFVSYQRKDNLSVSDRHGRLGLFKALFVTESIGMVKETQGRRTAVPDHCGTLVLDGIICHPSSRAFVKIGFHRPPTSESNMATENGYG